MIVTDMKDCFDHVDREALIDILRTSLLMTQTRIEVQRYSVYGLSTSAKMWAAHSRSTGREGTKNMHNQIGIQRVHGDMPLFGKEGADTSIVKYLKYHDFVVLRPVSHSRSIPMEVLLNGLQLLWKNVACFAGNLLPNGVPQGLSSSPLLADLYYGAKDGACNQSKSVRLHQSGGACLRYVDDLLYLSAHEEDIDAVTSFLSNVYRVPLQTHKTHHISIGKVDHLLPLWLCTCSRCVICLHIHMHTRTHMHTYARTVGMCFHFRCKW